MTLRNRPRDRHEETSGNVRLDSALSSATSKKKRKKSNSMLQRIFGESWTSELNKIQKKYQQGDSTKDDVFAAVNRLVAKGMRSDAIRLLYELKFYREAADLLRAVGATNEAARLYAKAKCWDQAENCFTKLQDRLNAARCAKSAGRYDKAAPVFQEYGEWHLAAKCYRRLGNWRKAAFFYGMAGSNAESIKCWQEWLRLDSQALSTELEKGELEVIIRLLSEGKFESVLFRILDANDYVSELVFALMKKNRMSMAAEIFDTRFQQVSRDLCSWVRTNPDMALQALSLCQSVNDLRGVAGLYEQLNRLREAVVCYESLGDNRAAYYCALKCEWWDKVSALRSFALEEGQTEVVPELILEDEFLQQHSAASLSFVTSPQALRLDSDIIELSANPAPNGFALNDQTGSGQTSPAFLGSRFFQRLRDIDRQKLWTIGRIVSFKAGETIVNIGQTPVGTFTLLSGRVEFFRQNGSLERLIDQINPGQNFGESWLMVNLHSAVKIVAAEDCHLHVIERTGFERFMAIGSRESSRIVATIAQTICGHLLGRIGTGLVGNNA